MESHRRLLPWICVSLGCPTRQTKHKGPTTENEFHDRPHPTSSMLSCRLFLKLKRKGGESRQPPSLPTLSTSGSSPDRPHASLPLQSVTDSHSQGFLGVQSLSSHAKEASITVSSQSYSLNQQANQLSACMQPSLSHLQAPGVGGDASGRLAEHLGASNRSTSIESPHRSFLLNPPLDDPLRSFQKQRAFTLPPHSEVNLALPGRRDTRWVRYRDSGTV